MPVLVIAASFAAQTHVVYAVFLTAMVASAIAAAIVSHKWWTHYPGGEKRILLGSIGLSALVGIAIWFPVFVSPEAIGIKNLIELARINLGQGGDWSTHATFSRFSYWFSAAYLAPFGVIAREGIRQAALPVTTLLALVQFFVFAAIAVRGYRKRLAVQFSLGFLGASSFLFSFALASHPEADSFPHLIRWISLCGPVFAGMIVSSWFHDRVPKRPFVLRSFVAFGLFGLIALGVIAAKASLDWMSIRDLVRFGWGKESYAPVWETLAPTMGKICMDGSHIRILDEEFWPYAAGIFLQLEKSGLVASVDDRWQFMYGKDKAPGFPKTDCLTVLSGTDHADFLSNTDFRVALTVTET